MILRLVKNVRNDYKIISIEIEGNIPVHKKRAIAERRQLWHARQSMEKWVIARRFKLPVELINKAKSSLGAFLHIKQIFNNALVIILGTFEDDVLTDHIRCASYW